MPAKRRCARGRPCVHLFPVPCPVTSCGHLEWAAAGVFTTRKSANTTPLNRLLNIYCPPTAPPHAKNLEMRLLLEVK